MFRDLIIEICPVYAGEGLREAMVPWKGRYYHDDCKSESEAFQEYEEIMTFEMEEFRRHHPNLMAGLAVERKARQPKK